MTKSKNINSGQIKISFPETNAAKSENKSTVDFETPVISINRNLELQKQRVAEILIKNSKAY